MEESFSQQREVLRLPEDRYPLVRKLAEYKTRIEPFRAPELQLDTLYKIAVLEPLVRDGEVNRTATREALSEAYGTVDERLFHNAWGVIMDYIETGGRKLFGGTGLHISEDNLTVRE